MINQKGNMFKAPPDQRWLRKAVDLEEQFDVSAGSEFQPKEDDVRNSHAASSLSPLQMAFSIFMHKLRIERRMTVEQLSREIDVDCEQLVLIEKSAGFKPPPRTLQKLSGFYKLPFKVIVQMAGAVTNVNPLLVRNAVQFAAKSESFEQLTRDEKKLLSEFVKLVRDID